MADLFVRPAWQADAACVGADPDLFFPTKGETSAEAAAICAGCTVFDLCRDYSADERFGVWAGLTAGARRRSRTKRSAS